MIQTLPEKWR